MFPPVRPSEKVAELGYVATLEDLGFVKAREVVVSDSSQVTQLFVWFILVQTMNKKFDSVPINDNLFNS